ncbi:hypothetical protein RHMOL_Rhmol07G0072300 [Rhododendron molle]|uniref:Uncharacterized protein n=1 Tax=Rhododendron molle TaxID=49168 RepID=A0ACC0N024_RHOML|nr:hypothetical protein RHMOL_Rhmol07G0072300 [Rhododendron molle]
MWRACIQVSAAGHLQHCSTHAWPLLLATPPTLTSVFDGSDASVLILCCFGSEPVQPPLMRKPSGRPRKLRGRGADEPPDENKVSRRFRVMSCSKCLKKGHNLRSCKNPIHPNSKLLKTKGTSSQAPNGKQSQKKAESIPAKQKQIVKANSTQDSVHTVNPGFYTQPAQVFKEPEWGFYSQQSKASSSTVNQTKAREKLPCIGGKGHGSRNVIRGRGKASANVVKGREGQLPGGTSELVINGF